MRRLVPHVLLSLSALLLTATCAVSGPRFVREQPDPGGAIIYVYRPAEMAGAIIDFRLFDITRLVDSKQIALVWDEKIASHRVKDTVGAMARGQELAVFRNGNYLAYGVAPGTHYFIVSADFQWGPTEQVTEVKVAAGESVFLEAPIGAGGRPHLFRTEANEGLSHIQDCVKIIK